MRMLASVVCLAISVSCSAAAAQSIKYRVNGLSPSLDVPPSGVITIGALNGDVILHIYQEGTVGGALPTADLPPLTIQGSVSDGSMLIGITAEDDAPFVALTPTEPFRRGVRNMSSIAFSSDALRDATTLVAWIGNETEGSVLGDIAVGRIYVIDAPNDITGHLTATADDPVPSGGIPTRGSADYAIQRVRVGHLLGGPVTASPGCRRTVAGRDRSAS